MGQRREILLKHKMVKTLFSVRLLPMAAVGGHNTVRHQQEMVEVVAVVLLVFLLERQHNPLDMVIMVELDGVAKLSEVVEVVVLVL